ncbi:hypothetical protein [Yersinia massiliensis]|uniref:hypothetical protein n=1 Tax=Yersinia massiliensis TaxID=419257 RepID=UPI00119DACA6|nr:hypothetical protein [Yersinia massiliensis]
MYALTIIKHTPDSSSVYSRQVLGDWYELEFYPNGKESNTVAVIKYNKGDSIPASEINRDDEAYITLLTGETVHVVCRGKVNRNN